MTLWLFIALLPAAEKMARALVLQQIKRGNLPGVNQSHTEPCQR